MIPQGFVKTEISRQTNFSKYTKSLGLEHKLLSSLTNKLGKKVVEKIKADNDRIISHYKQIKKNHDKSLTAAEKWLEENKSLVLESAESLKNSLSSRLISRLPTLKSNPSKIRILEALICLITQTDHQLNYNRIKKFVDEYQLEAKLTVAELWAIPLISQAILIDSLSFSLTDEKKIKEIVLGLRNLQKIDWGEFIEEVSLVDKILRHDPSGTYPLMDFRTRDTYRHAVEGVHFETGHEEIEIAKWVVEEAKKSGANISSYPQNHIGYFLIGLGRSRIDKFFYPRRRLSENFSLLLRRRPIKVYLGLIWGFAIMLFVLLQAVLNLPGPWWLLLVFPSFQFANLATHLIAVRLYSPDYIPKMNPALPVLEKDRTMILVPTLLLPDKEYVAQILQDLEESFLANKDENIFFGLALAWPDTTKNSGKPTSEELEALEFAKKEIEILNHKYPGNNSRFHLFFRDRKWSIDEQKWVEWERKRGKIIEFVHLLRGATNTTFSFSTATPEFLSTIKYVITVDDDVTVPRDAAKKLVATIIHPLNLPIIDKKSQTVVSGYGIIQPRISTQLSSSGKSFADYVFTGDSGWDSYSNAVSNIYQDIFKESFFMGRGIFDVDAFNKILTGRFPENTLLSHDHIEGFYCRTGFASDIQLFESSPSSYSAFSRRLHRWVRGDWQRLFWILPWVGNEKGKVEKNPLATFHRWKLVEDMIQNLGFPATIILVLVLTTLYPDKQISGLLLFLAVFLVNPLLSFVESVPLRKSVFRAWKHYFLIFSEDVKAFVIKSLFNLVFSLHQSILISHAIVTALTRLFITKRKRLEWAIFIQTNSKSNGNFYSYLWDVMPAVVCSVLLLVGTFLFLPPEHQLIPIIIVFIWFQMPLFIDWINREPKKQKFFSDSEEQKLRVVARKTWRFFDDLVSKKTNYLPPDHYQQTTPVPVSNRTSATDMGMYFVSLVGAFDLGFISGKNLLERSTRTLTTLSKLDQLRGHFFNWYDILTLKVLPPSYVSTVDSGNLAVSLLVTHQSLCDLADTPIVKKEFLVAIDDLLEIAKEESEPVLAGQLGQIQEKIIKSNPLTLSQWYELFVSILKEVEGIEADKASEIGYWVEEIKESLTENISNLIYFLPSVAKSDFKFLTPRELLNQTDKVGRSNTQRFITQCNKESDLAEALAMRMDFSFLYDAKRNLFKIGYNLFNKTFDRSYYDLFASEARIASLFAIAKYDVPLKHWSTMTRPMTSYHNWAALLSWGGSVFEYLFPNLFLPNYPSTLLWESYSTIVSGHIAYAQKNRIPWGISESSYGLTNKDGHYRYKLHGAPDFGLKQFTYKDLVVAPYATFLSLEILPHQAMTNIKRLEREGLLSIYGMYESVDYTNYESGPIPDRIIRTFLCHHQGVIIASVANILKDFSIRKRLTRVGVIKSHLALLQESSPREISFSIAKNSPETDISEEQTQIPETALLSSPNLVKPRHKPQFNSLGNGRYFVYLDDRGGGYSQYQHFRLTNWINDPALDLWGNFQYIKDSETQKVWSPTLGPMMNVTAEKYEVSFSPNFAKITRLNWGIETTLEVVVPNDFDLEVRCLTIKNVSAQKRVLELTNYAEITLDDPISSQSHPVFSKMKVKSEFDPFSQVLFFQRLSPPLVNVPMFASKILFENSFTKTKYDTDRKKVLGRAGSVELPAAVTQPKMLEGTSGFVLDPVICQNFSITLKPGASQTVCFLYTAAYGKQAALDNLNKYVDSIMVRDLLESAKTITITHNHFENVNQRIIQQVITCLFYGRELSSEKYTHTYIQSLVPPTMEINWVLPTMVVLIRSSAGTGFIQQCLNLSYVIANKGVQFNVVFIVQDSDNYYQKTYNTILQVANQFETTVVNNNLLSPSITILRTNNLKPKEVSYLVATSSLVLDSRNGNIGGQINKEFSKI